MADAQTHHREQVANQVADPDYAVSVFAIAKRTGATVDQVKQELVEYAKEHRKSRWIAFTSDAALAAAGFRLRHSPPPDRHYDVILGTEPDVTRVKQLEELFNVEDRMRMQ